MDLFAQQAVEELKEARLQYYKHQIKPAERDSLAEQIAGLMHIAFPKFAEQITGKKEIAARNKALLKEWFEHATISAPFFNMDFFYPEVKEAGGFDVVIGNPPYGGTKILDEVRTALNLESKDPYGAFIARFLGAAQQATPLKHRGVLAYIVSDTFMTIKSHLPLRKQMMDNYIHKMIRVHPDTFRATVNTVIIIGERNMTTEKSEHGHLIKKLNKDHCVLMADLTNVSIHDNHERFVELLHLTIGHNVVDNKYESTPDFAYYTFPQVVIAANSNLPFFVGSPKLFVLMNDVGNNGEKEELRQNIYARKVSINKKVISLLRLADFGETKQGIKTGDNYYYIFKNELAEGTYENITENIQYVLSEKELIRIRSNEELRQDISENGFSNRKNSARYFDGKYIVPLDKGGESDSSGGFIPNYFVKTDYFIDWSEASVNRMKALTTKERNNYYKTPGGDDSICSRLQNLSYSFLEGITYSPTGIYAPT